MIRSFFFASLGFVCSFASHAQAKLPRRDAAVETIMVPSDDPRYALLNPAVQEPRIILRNKGADPLAAISIRYGTEGFLPRMFAWNGHLASGASTEVKLPQIMDMRNGTNTFTVTLGHPNGKRDANEADNTLSTAFTAAPLLGSLLTVRWRVPAGVGGKLIMESTRGLVPMERSWIAGPDSVMSEEVELVAGSYVMHLSDSGRTAHASVRIFDHEGNLITALRSKERTGSTFQFRVEAAAAAMSNAGSDAELVMLPGSGKALVDVFVNEKTMLVVTDGSGERVVEWPVPERTNAIHRIDLSARPAGSYAINLVSKGTEVAVGRIDLFDEGPR